jgi:hypothetical protein
MANGKELLPTEQVVDVGRLANLISLTARHNAIEYDRDAIKTAGGEWRLIPGRDGKQWRFWRDPDWDGSMP